MMIRHIRNGDHRWQLVLALVFACALLARLAVPEGWMPVQDAHGWRLTICTGMGPLDAMPTMTMDHGHKDSAGDHGKSSVCPFAGLGLALADHYVPPFAFVMPVFASVAQPLHALVSIGRGLAAPPPPQTGPPLLD